MLFNSLEFLLFLPTVFVLYWFVFKNQLRAQNILLLVASYVFYGWWDWRFLSLIVLSTAIDYFVGLQLEKTAESSKRKLLLGLSLTANLGMLGFFKYFNFFVQSWVDAWASVGVTMQGTTLEIILPVGISFYTFQTLSYTLDVYRKDLYAEYSFVKFATYVSFFPQLVAGPIERATNLLPQFSIKRNFNYSKAVEGLRQILWGLFKKMVIADNCAIYANDIFNHSSEYTGSTLLLGAIFFSFQIYGDFSGYSDIAIGISKLFGFDLMKNFNYPYFSRDIAEFWRRWHISLSTWFRDYIYIPLGGSKSNKRIKIRNVFIIFLVSGFWHGANWTFIVWGLVNAILFLPLLLKEKNRVNVDVISKTNIKTMVSIFSTFLIVALIWVLFRANNIAHAFEYYNGIFSKSFFNIPSYYNYVKSFPILILICFLIIVEWSNRERDFGLSEYYLIIKNKLIRWFFYSIIIFLIFMFMITEETPFIYFQF